MKKASSPKPKYGAEPRYRFVLNPYVDQRFTRCPGCEALMKVRKCQLDNAREEARVLEGGSG